MPRQGICMKLGYLGDRYSGMQFQKDLKIRTIQNELQRALVQLGLLYLQADYTKINKWSRAARTDKGVHSVCNAVSFHSDFSKFLDEEGKLRKDKLEAQIRSLLPQDIKLFKVFSVIGTFEVRNNINARIYHYLLPKRILENRGSDQQTLARINSVCKFFVGTHNFHNYSKGFQAKKAQSKRLVMQFSCQEVDQEFLRFKIRGQSFIYNQIRKMVGCVIQIFKQDLPDAFVQNTFYNNIIKITLAPPFGLYLSRLDLSAYNGRKVPQVLCVQQQALSEFQQFVQEQIMKKEKNDQLFSKWKQEDQLAY